jgi:phosphomannomutase
MSDTLIASVSGVRGLVGKDLTPEFVARYAAAFGLIVRDRGVNSVVVGRDARTSGPMFLAATKAGLQSVGTNVVDCGLIPTPTLQLAVEFHEAAGGIVITASHNPVEWNALKFVGSDGLFLNQETASKLFELVADGTIDRCGWDSLGEKTVDDFAVERHLEEVLALELVDVDAIRARNFTVALDCVRGAGGTIMPALLDRLGCTVVGRDLEPDGCFTRAPEPIPANLGPLEELVRSSGADLGIAVDPDVDRLALVDGTGRAIGEDYTLAFAVQAILRQRRGPVVANLSTSLVVDDAAREFDIAVERAPVGEANVARAMQAVHAVIGGEGNGGVMLPDLHLGRDAPVGAILTLDLMAQTGLSVSELVAAKPSYSIVKAKTGRSGVLEEVYAALGNRFADATKDCQDGLRLAWDDSWLHVRPSGTEPIVRLIAEAPTEQAAQALVTAAKETMDTTGGRS